MANLFEGKFDVHRPHGILGLLRNDFFEKFHFNFVGFLVAAPHSLEVQTVLLQL